MSLQYPNSDKLVLAKVKLAFYNWIRKQSEGLIPQNQILFRDQSEPLPARPCVALKITSGPIRTGYQDHMTLNSDDPLDFKFKIAGQRVLVISVQVYGNLNVHKPMAYQLALDLNSSLSLQTVLYDLRKSGIAIFDQGGVTNLTEIEESEYEERAEFSIRVGVAENQQDDPGYFDHVGPIAENITD